MVFLRVGFKQVDRKSENVQKWGICGLFYGIRTL